MSRAAFGLISAGILLLATPVLAEMKQVQFIVLVPDTNQNQPARIFMASSLDGWDERGRPLERIAPGLYSAIFSLEANQSVEYKFTRLGSWATVEKSAEGQEISNRRLQIEFALDEQVVVHYVVRWADLAPAARRQVELSPLPSVTPTTAKSTLTGDVRVHHNFHSPQLENQRALIVYLPPGYEDDPQKRYPVLYMHDGNNIFDARAASVEWRADETAEDLIRTGQIGGLIIVGIFNNADRHNEYTPFRDSNRGGGRGDTYLAFIVETVKPFIDKTYRTQPGREHTGIAGSSLGGLISLYAVHKYPQVFSRAGVISPALWWADYATLKYVHEHQATEPIKIWIDIGTSEGRRSTSTAVSIHVAGCRRLMKILAAQGYQRDVDFHYEEIEGGRHNETAWAARFNRVLQFLWTANGPPREED